MPVKDKHAYPFKSVLKSSGQKLQQNVQNVDKNCIPKDMMHQSGLQVSQIC